MAHTKAFGKGRLSVRRAPRWGGKSFPGYALQRFPSPRQKADISILPNYRTFLLCLDTGRAALWARRFILFHNKRHPAQMGGAEVEAFLTHLAVTDRVAAATQNQALSALLFLYREVPGLDLAWLTKVVRAKRPARLPVVLTRHEVTQVLERMEGSVYGLMTRLFGFEGGKI
ncbi:hypothetical protein FACS1894154_09260 [Betaproteobacteria bacterium]|nr:hypothetical protein FACS1894154_09260 [Betaproteobacteria bacterium]